MNTFGEKRFSYWILSCDFSCFQLWGGLGFGWGFFAFDSSFLSQLIHFLQAGKNI